MNKKAEKQPIASSFVKLHPAGMISLMTFLTAFPAGYVLTIINWHRMGNEDKERNYIMALILSSLFMILLLPFYSQGVFAFVINIAFGVYFYNDMTYALNLYAQTGNTYVKENIFAGSLIGFLTGIIWIIVAAILTNGISLLTDMVLFNIQR